MYLGDLPGGELIAEGLQDMHQQKPGTACALLVSIAAERLRGLGLEFPEEEVVPHAELRLYQLLQSTSEDPYNAYNALISLLVSFSNSLEHRRWLDAQRQRAT